MVRIVCSSLTILLLAARTSFAQAPDSANTDDAISAIVERLDAAPDPDALAARAQELIDERQTSDMAGGLHYVLMSRVQYGLGLDDSDEYVRRYYRGSPLKTATSFIARSSKFEVSLVEAKDPGEPLYLDHLVGSVSLRSPVELGGATLKRCVIGSYSLSYGEGLAFGKGYPMFASLGSVASPHSERNIGPYHSASSYRYFNGGAASVELGAFAVDGFFSARHIDAAIDSGKITYISTSGYHRTTTELDRISTATEQVAGGALHWRDSIATNTRLELGAVGLRTTYSLPLAVDSTSSYFGHDGSVVASCFASLSTEVSTLRAECASSWSGDHSTLAAVLDAEIKPSQSFHIAGNVHFIPPKFYSPFIGTFGAASDDDLHEEGAYLGVSLDVISGLTLDSYGTLAFRPLDTTTPDRTDRRSELALGLSYKIGSRTMSVRVRGANISVADRRTLDAKLEYAEELTAIARVVLQGRIKLLRASPDVTATSYAAGIGARFLIGSVATLGVLAEPFETPSYDARLYSIESEIGGFVPFVALYGSGSRIKAIATYDPTTWLHLAASAAQTITSSPGTQTVAKATTISFVAESRF